MISAGDGRLSRSDPWEPGGEVPPGNDRWHMVVYCDETLFPSVEHYRILIPSAFSGS
jgi:hypothetical protein